MSYAYLRVVNEGLPVSRTGGKRPRARVLKTLDHGCLAAPVSADDHGERRVELDDLYKGSGTKQSVRSKMGKRW